jgi:hypothetical protein
MRRGKKPVGQSQRVCIVVGGVDILGEEGGYIALN